MADKKLSWTENESGTEIVDIAGPGKDLLYGLAVLSCELYEMGIPKDILVDVVRFGLDDAEKRKAQKEAEHHG